MKIRLFIVMPILCLRELIFVSIIVFGKISFIRRSVEKLWLNIDLFPGAKLFHTVNGRLKSRLVEDFLIIILNCVSQQLINVLFVNLFLVLWCSHGAN